MPVNATVPRHSKDALNRQDRLELGECNPTRGQNPSLIEAVYAEKILSRYGRSLRW
jgi:hypothetical protein